ncbi:hypothetical protein AB1L88_01390 [Tautonia sp. JC769]
MTVGHWDAARVDDFVCVTCGYMESYVKEIDLVAFEKHWEPLDQAELV